MQRLEIVSAGVDNPRKFGGYFAFFDRNKKPRMQPHDIKVLNIGDDYLETIGIKMLEERGFPSVSNFDDENSFLVNEAAVKLMEIEPLVIDYMDLEKSLISVMTSSPLILYMKQSD